jgi:hypothetical protein
VRRACVPAGGQVEGYWTLDGDALDVERRTSGGRWELTDAIVLRDLHRGLPRLVAGQLDAVHFLPVGDGHQARAERLLAFGPPLPPLREWASDQYAAALAPELSLSGGSVPRAYPLTLALCCFKLRRGGLTGVRTVLLPVDGAPPGPAWRVDVDILRSLFQRLTNRANAVQHVDLDRIVDQDSGLLADLRQLRGRWEADRDHRDPAVQQTRNAIDALAGAFARDASAPTEREELRWRVRMSCLFLAYEALAARETDLGSGGAGRDGWRRLAHDLLDAYAMLALFERRLRGRQPWSEGILVVKEPALELAAEEPAVSG